jgi:hypothetical protein
VFLSVNNYKFDEYNVKLSEKIKNIYHNIIISKDKMGRIYFNKLHTPYNG